MSYESGLIHSVDILLASQARGARGGTADVYSTVTAGVPARVTTPKVSEVDAYAKRNVRLAAKVMLPAGTRLTDKHALRFVEAGSGRVRILTVHAAYDPHEMGRLYVALCEEDES